MSSKDNTTKLKKKQYHHFTRDDRCKIETLINLKDENGKFYYGWVIVLVAGLLCGLVYSGIVSVTGIFLLPVTMELELPIGGYSFYLTIMSIANMLTLLVISKFLNENSSDAYRILEELVSTAISSKII